MRLLSLTLLALTLHCVEEVKLPPDAQSAIDKADKSIATIQAKADGEITKVRLALITTLTDCQKSTTKKGDLDGALAIKAKIEALDKLMPSGDLLGEKEKSTEKINIAGEWRMNESANFTITKENKAMCASGGGKVIIKKDALVITWDNGYIDTYVYPPKDNVLEGQNQNGLKLRSIKIH